MEVLRLEDVEKERKGIVAAGVRWFPKAKPLKMLRIFRTKFKNLEHASEEINRVKLIQRHLGPDHFAVSEEFLVDYSGSSECRLLLCGLQAYVEGEILDPWRHHNRNQLEQVLIRLNPEAERSREALEASVTLFLTRAKAFATRLRGMVMNANYVPDLAGVGNLLIAPDGSIKLVDINNISRVSYRPSIGLDDKGYPVCDKSIEALSLLEEKLLGAPVDRSDPLYRTFLDPVRMREVRNIVKSFHESTKLNDYRAD